MCLKIHDTAPLNVNLESYYNPIKLEWLPVYLSDCEDVCNL